ncbi:MAG: DivIVA domain-containing protein [Desulfobacterales bacterium]
MKLTPLDIQQQQFKVKFRGFDIQEVDNFLEQMASEFEALQNENIILQEQISKLAAEIKSFKSREDTFKRALANSQKVMEQMKENARKSAELILSNAEVKAEKLLNKAHNRLAQLHEDTAELKRQRMQIEIQIRSIIETYTKLLDMGKEERKKMDEEDSKVAFLKQS